MDEKSNSRLIGPSSIAWSSLSVDQQSRAVRLSAILKATFGSHGRIAVMIQSFQEGIDIVLGVALGDPYSSSNLYLGNGFRTSEAIVPRSQSP